MSIPANTRAKTVGLWHGIGNMVLAALFLLSGWLRYGAADYVPSTLALAFSFGAIILGLFTAWMGGELVERLGIAVHEGAHADAPSSLSGLPADNTGEPERLAEERGQRRAA